MYFNEIYAILKEIVLDSDYSIDLDTDLFEEGLMDSLATMNMFLQLEQSFGVNVDLAEIEIEDFATVRKINEYVVSNIH